MSWRWLLPLLAAAPLGAGALELECEPAHPYFCGNIHVGCAGRTEVPTFRFRIRAEGARGWIESASGSAEARAEWGGDDTRLILWPRGTRDYVRVMADGRYSFRRYAGDAGIMSHGQCRAPLRGG